MFIYLLRAKLSLKKPCQIQGLTIKVIKGAYFCCTKPNPNNVSQCDRNFAYFSDFSELLPFSSCCMTSAEKEQPIGWRGTSRTSTNNYGLLIYAGGQISLNYTVNHVGKSVMLLPLQCGCYFTSRIKVPSLNTSSPKYKASSPPIILLLFFTSLPLNHTHLLSTHKAPQTSAYLASPASHQISPPLDRGKLTALSCQ